MQSADCERLRLVNQLHPLTSSILLWLNLLLIYRRLRSALPNGYFAIRAARDDQVVSQLFTCIHLINVSDAEVTISFHKRLRGT